MLQVAVSMAYIIKMEIDGDKGLRVVQHAFVRYVPEIQLQQFNYSSTLICIV